MSSRQLLVSKIENGIVIDHIPAGKAFQVLRLLKLDPSARAVIAQNVDSRSLGRKDLIKVEGTYLTSKEIDLIALVAPSATLNIVEDWGVKEKRRVQLPRSSRASSGARTPSAPPTRSTPPLGPSSASRRRSGWRRSSSTALTVAPSSTTVRYWITSTATTSHWRGEGWYPWGG